MKNCIYLCFVLYIATFSLNGLANGEALNGVTSLNETGLAIYQKFIRKATEHMELSSGRDLRITMNKPAQWQQIPTCSVPPDIRFSEVSNAGKLTASVVCHNSGNSPDSNWKRRLSANTDFMVNVVITSSDIKKGGILNDLKRVIRPVSSVVNAAVAVIASSSVKAYEGYIALRPIKAGTVLTEDLVKKPNVVQKGAAVTVVASASAIMVTTEGTTMDSGRVGDVIRVKKNNGRVISCAVISEQEVRPVSLPQPSASSR